MRAPSGRWFGDGDSASFGWLSLPSDGASRSGVLIAPALGYPWWSSYQTLRELAERLADAGHIVLRLSYPGTGNSTGSAWEDRGLSGARSSLRAGAEELRRLGAQTVSLVGVRVGASLALMMGSELDAGAVVAWAPVVNGRREARGLKMRSTPVPDEYAAAGTVAFAGSIFGPGLLADIGRLDVSSLVDAAPRVLLIDADDAPALAQRLSTLGADTEQVTTPDGDQALTVPAEDAVIADQVIAATAAWLDEGGPRPNPAAHPDPVPPAPADTIHFTDHGHALQERVLRLGAHQLTAIESQPADGPTRDGTVVLLNTGSEPQVGAGNVWVELARDLAGHGHRALRIDYRGWGDSPDHGCRPGRPYDAHAIADTIEITRALTAQGDGPVTLVGVCAGAWTALKAVLEEPAHAVIALNPQLYYETGHPVIALMSDVRVWRTETRLEEEEGRRTGRWDALDRAGQRNPAGRWLDELAAGPTQVTMLFAEADDGLEYLHNRLAARLQDVTTNHDIHVQEIPGIDHPMHRAWLRPRMFTAIRTALDRPSTDRGSRRD